MNLVKTTKSLSIGLIAILLGFPQISETIYTPSLPYLAHDLNIPESWAEFTLSIYFIGFALGVFAWGVVADKLGRRPTMLWAIGIYILGCWGCYQSTSMASILIWRFIQAVGASAGSIVTQTMIRDLYSGSYRNQIFSIVGGILAFSPALGPFLGGWIDQMAGWRANFASLMGMGGLLLVYSFLKLPETKPVDMKQRISFKRVALQFFKDRQIFGYAILIGASNGIIFSYYAEAPFLFIEILHFTPTQYGFTGLIIASFSVIASFISHQLNARQYRHEHLLLVGCSIMAFAVLGLIFLAYQNVFAQASLPHLMLILGSIGVLFLGIGLVIPNALSQALSCYQQSIGTAGALFGLIYYMMIASLTFLMGIFHNGTALPMPLYFLALVVLMYCSLYYFIIKKLKSPNHLEKQQDLCS